MPTIRLLDKSVAELIAAGEVVERPASVVKELVENAIDAGAGDISVEIKGGGIGYLRVSDNGCGIAPEEMPLAFLRHATSKVQTEQDLNTILTMGFRGEALASIAAMGRVEMRSKQKGNEGARLSADASGIGEIVPDGCPDGTTIIVRDLFYNTPARMKFLRRDVTEGNAVSQVVEKLALAHPEIAFRFLRDKQTKLRTSGSGDLLSVIAQVYDRGMAEDMIPVDYLYERRIRVTGYIGDPAAARASRLFQTFYINRRYVKVRACGAAVEEAFKGSLMTGRFPVCVLNLEMPPEEVDVNVHPAKTEVRFLDERPIFQSVYWAAKAALSAKNAPLEPVSRPKINPLTIDLVEESPVQQRFPGGSGHDIRWQEENLQPEHPFSKPLSFSASGLPQRTERPPGTVIPSAVFDRFRAELSVTMEEKDEPVREAAPEAAPEPPSLRLIGELFATYILLEQGEDFLLVDKHAAHEGVLYQKILREAREGHRQMLLSGVPVTLPQEEYTLLLENTARLEEIGFLAEEFGAGTLIIRETPPALHRDDIAPTLSEIAQRLLEGNDRLTPSALDSLYYSIACKSAVRAGDRGSREELSQIISLLREHPDVTHCPHGRPIVVRLSKQKLERMFGRRE